MKWISRGLLAGSLVIGGVTVLPVAASAGTASTVLPVTSVGEIVVDSAHQHLFISDPAADQVLVTDYAGAKISTLSLPDVGGMVIGGDRLYVAEPDSSEIAGFDTATLQRRDYLNASGHRPDRLAYASDKLWYSFGTGIGAINLVSQYSYQMTADQSLWTDVTGLAAVGNVLVVIGKNGQAGRMAYYNTAGELPEYPKRFAYTTVPVGTGTLRVALSSDGSQTVVVGAAPAAALRYSTGATEKSGTYDVSTAANAAAVADDGTVVISDAPGLAYFPASGDASRVGSDPIQTFAVEPGGSRAFALTTDSASRVVLQVLSQSDKQTLTGYITPPDRVRPGTEYTVRGAVNAPAGAESPVGLPMEITRLSDGALVGPTTVPAGEFQFTEKAPDTAGTITYRLTVAGDDRFFNLTASTPLTVAAPSTPTVQLDHNGSTYNYGTTVTFTGFLGHTYTNRTLAIYADPAGADQPNRVLVNKVVDDNYNVSGTLKLTRNTVVTAVFTGDVGTNAKTVTSTVYTRASVSTSVTKAYKMSGSTYVFHKKTNPVLTTTMTAYAKRKQYLTVEYYSAGKWHTAKAASYTLTSAGKSTVTFTGTHKTGITYRVRAAYLNGKSGDTVNTTTYGTYRYFKFTS